MTGAPVPGWQKLLDDCDAVEEKFKEPNFSGTFYFADWGSHEKSDHPPEGKNFCGTQACLAGWFGLVGKHEFKAAWGADGELNPVDTLETWTEMAEDVYGLDHEQAHELFCEGSNPSLALKLEEARDLAAYLKEEAEQS